VLLGALVGWLLGALLGALVGHALGSLVGHALGWLLGHALGSLVGHALGWLLGHALGSACMVGLAKRIKNVTTLNNFHIYLYTYIYPYNIKMEDKKPHEKKSDDPESESDSEPENEPEHKSKTGAWIAVGVSIIIGIVIALIYYYKIYLPNQTEQAAALAAATAAQQQAAAAQAAALLAAQRSATAQQANQPSQPAKPIDTPAKPTTAQTVQDTITKGTQQAAQDAANVAQQSAQTSATVAAQMAAAQQATRDAAQQAIRASIEAALNSTQAAQTAAQSSIDAVHAAYSALTEQLTNAYQYVGGCTYAVYSNATPSTPTATLAMIYTLLKPEQQASASNAGMQNPLMANLITQYNTIEAAIAQMEIISGQIAGYTTSLKRQTNEEAAHLDSTSAQSAAASCASMLASTIKQINIVTQLIGPATQAAVQAVQTNAATTLNVTQDNTTAAVQAAKAQSELLIKQQQIIAASNTAAINAANAAANAAAAAAAESIAQIAAQNAVQALAVAQATAAADTAAISTAIQTIQLAQTGINTELNSAITQAAVAQTAIQGAAIYLGACGMQTMAQFPFSITNAILLVANNTTGALINAYNNFTLNQQKQMAVVGNTHPYIAQITAALAPVQTQISTLQTTSELISGYLATAKSEPKVQSAQNAANLATQAAATSAAASAAITAALNIVNNGLQNNIPVLATNIQTALATYSGPLQVLYYADDYMYIYQNGALMGNNSNHPGCAGVLAYDLDNVTTGDVITFMVQNMGGGSGLAAQWQWGPTWRGGLPNTSPIVSKNDLYIATAAMFSGSSGSTSKWTLNATAMQNGMPATAYSPGITAPENLSTLAANFTPTIPMMVDASTGWGMCTGPASGYTQMLTSGGQVSEQSRCQVCYIAFNWNVPLVTRDPAEPFSTTIKNMSAYIATLTAKPAPVDPSIITAPYSGTFGADNFLFLYRNGQIVYDNWGVMSQYHALAGVAKSGDVFDFVVQNNGGPGAFVGRLSWNGTTYYTGTSGSRSDLFKDNPYTATIGAPDANRAWPPYERLITQWKTAPGPIAVLPLDSWCGPFPGSLPIFDNKQIGNSYVMFRWVVPKVQPAPYKQVAGNFWLGANSGSYTCPKAKGVATDTPHKGYCSFVGPDAQANVEEWCDSDPLCTGYVYGLETGYRYIAGKTEPVANGSFPPNQYFKKQSSSFTSGGYFARAVR
jgi:hypothetical protein